MHSAFSKYNNEKIIIKRQTQNKNKNEIKTKKAKYENNIEPITSSTPSIADLSYQNDSINVNTSSNNNNNDNDEMNYEVDEDENETTRISDQIEVEENDEELETSGEQSINDSKIIGLETFNNSNILNDLFDLSLNDTNNNNNNNNDDDNNDLLLLILDLNEKFVFKGKVMAKILHGTININGYILTSSNNKHKSTFYKIYSPDTHSNLMITNKTTTTQINNHHSNQQIINNVLNSLYEINKNLNKQLLINYLNENLNNQYKSIILFKKFKSKLCNYFTKYDHFKHMYQTSHLINYITNPNDIKFAYLGLYPVESSNSILNISSFEDDIINEIVKKSRENTNKAEVIVACGGKDVGKSTYLRYLVNSLLNQHEKVAYLDCDPGQCEFTISGNVQLTIIQEPLLGPPHTHLVHSPDSCYFLGFLSPNDIPGNYLDSIRKCYNFYQQNNNNSDNNCKIPLIVNTMGWNQGLGLCLLKEQINILQPTFVIQLNSQDNNKNLPIIDYDWYNNNSTGWPPRQDINCYSKPNYKLFTIDRGLNNELQQQHLQRRKIINYSAKDHRTIAVIAYFSSLQEKHSYFKSIHHLRPYRVPWSHFAVHIAHMKVAYEELFRVLNASLVGLCKIDDKLIKRHESANSNNQLPGYLDDLNTNINSFKCYGFGIIRGINVNTKEFYIITPEPIEKLNQINLLVKGMINVPVEFFFEQDSETSSPYVAFVDNNRTNVIASEPIQRKFLIHQSDSKLTKNSSK